MSTSLTPSERIQRARLAAYTLHSRVDSREHTAPARKAGPGQLEYWMARVDPDHQLTETERARRATAAKRAFYVALALKSAKARRKAS